MLIIIGLIVGLFLFWFISDNISKNNEINNDPTLSAGLINKYPLLFDTLKRDEFNITETKKDEVKMVRLITIPGSTIRIEITIMYQAGNRIHFIVQIYLVNPSRHIKTKSFFYSSNANEEALTKRATDDMGVFLLDTLQGT